MCEWNPNFLCLVSPKLERSCEDSRIKWLAIGVLKSAKHMIHKKALATWRDESFFMETKWGGWARNPPCPQSRLVPFGTTCTSLAQRAQNHISPHSFANIGPKGVMGYSKSHAMNARVTNFIIKVFTMCCYNGPSGTTSRLQSSCLGTTTNPSEISYSM